MFSTASNERLKLCQHNRYLISCIDFSFLGGKLKRVVTACAPLFPATANIPPNFEVYALQQEIHTRARTLR